MNRLVSTEVSVVQRNARDWLGLVEPASGALGEVQDDDEIPSGELAMGNDIQIAIVRPRNFRDAATVGEYFRQEIPVIINLEDMDNASATRIIDFVSGLILGLCGDIEKLSRRAFLIVPAGATIITTHDALTEEGFFNQALRPGLLNLVDSVQDRVVDGGGNGEAQVGLVAGGQLCSSQYTSVWTFEGSSSQSP
jgi:cell division inhibitor SepF